MIELGSIATEVEVVLDFLEPSLTAQRRFFPVWQEIIDTKEPTANQWKKFTEDWDSAKEKIAKLGKISDKKVKKLRSQFLRNKLMKLRDLSNSLAGDIDKGFKNKDREVLLIHLLALEGGLTGINSAAGHLMDDLQFGLQEAANHAKGEAGPGDEWKPRESFVSNLKKAAP